MLKCSSGGASPPLHTRLNSPSIVCCKLRMCAMTPPRSSSYTPRSAQKSWELGKENFSLRETFAHGNEKTRLSRLSFFALFVTLLSCSASSDHWRGLHLNLSHPHTAYHTFRVLQRIATHPFYFHSDIHSMLGNQYSLSFIHLLSNNSIHLPLVILNYRKVFMFSSTISESLLFIM
jgi:hypothetical protein